MHTRLLPPVRPRQPLARTLLAFGLALVPCAVLQAASLLVGHLKCEYQEHPLAVHASTPRLSWIVEATARDQHPSACQVLAATAPRLLAMGQADLWDSGKTPMDASGSANYAGRSLHSGQRVYWTVRVWDAAGRASAFAPAAWFEMGLLQPSDWRAQWIQKQVDHVIPPERAFDDHPAPLLRKEFTLSKKVARARAYVSGLGYYELRLNGQRVGDQVLDPGWTAYGKRVLYSAYDITAQLQRGPNALGVMLGHGWFNPLPIRMWGHINPRDALLTGEPRAIVQVRIEFADGTTQEIVTDESWRASDGPVVRNSVYLGEVYDARREQPGWDRPGFDDAAWPGAVRSDQPAVGPLVAQEAPPIRITRILPAVKLTEPKPGVFVFDFGQNFAGWVRLRVQGPAGTRVRLRSGELIYPDGMLNGMTAVVGQAKQGGKDYQYDGVGQPKTAFQLDEYVLSGRGPENYTPRFTFHGFRYVEVTGFPGRPTLNTLEGLRLNSDVAPVGTFECSNELLNRIQKMVLWTELSNLFSVQSDCPHREKFGYGGDIVASSEMAMFNFDMARFYRKAARDLVDAARPNGGFTETAPFVGISDEGLGGMAGPIGWGTAQPLLLTQLRQFYGERRLLEEQYGATRNWMRLLRERAQDGILDNGISDHESLAPKPRALTGTGFYFLNEKLFAQLARTLGHAEEAADAEARSERIREAFNRKFLQPGTGRYDIASQACQSFALHLGLAPEEEKERALQVLVRDVLEGHQGHLTTGIFGTKYLLGALTAAGRADVAYAVVNQQTFPGWGHMLAQGATTLWEHWEFSDNTFSHNHPMFGSVSEWFYKALAGIRPAADAVGFDKIILQPQLVGDLRWVKASYDSVRGRVVSGWRREGDRFTWEVRVPVGCTATAYLPARDAASVRESGRPLRRGAGVRVLREERGQVVLSLGSGEYHLVSSVAASGESGRQGK